MIISRRNLFSLFPLAVAGSAVAAPAAPESAIEEWLISLHPQDAADFLAESLARVMSRAEGGHPYLVKSSMKIGFHFISRHSEEEQQIKNARVITHQSAPPFAADRTAGSGFRNLSRDQNKNT